MTEKEALNQAMKLCSRKEYASGEIRAKLLGWEISAEAAENIISQLIKEKFIDDNRYCRAFVNDKLRFSKWGKTKIAYMLRQKQIAEIIIAETLDAIDDELYESILQAELSKKAKMLKADNDYTFKGKLIQFAASRGFEYDVASRLAEKLKR